MNSLVLVYYQRFHHNSTGMDCWKHYPWISAPKRIVKNGICAYDWVSVSVTINWKGNTVIALEKLPCQGYLPLEGYIKLLIMATV